MGSALYIYAINFSKKGLIATAYVGPIPLLVVIIVKLLLASYHKYKNGKFFDKAKSNFINVDNTLKKRNMIPLITSIYANCAHYVFLTFAFKYAKLAGMNQGVVTIIIIMASVFNSISFWLAFGEKPSCSKFVGMFFCLGTTVLLGINGALKGNEQSSGKD